MKNIETLLNEACIHLTENGLGLVTLEAIETSESLNTELIRQIFSARSNDWTAYEVRPLVAGSDETPRMEGLVLMGFMPSVGGKELPIKVDASLSEGTALVKGSGGLAWSVNMVTGKVKSEQVGGKVRGEQ